MNLSHALSQYLVQRRLAKEERKFAHVRSLEDKFRLAYATNHWGNRRTRQIAFWSGPGSCPQKNQVYVDAAVQTIISRSARQIIDVGCGDFTMGKAILDKLRHQAYGVDYLGLDLVEALVTHNRETFAQDAVRFDTLNVVDERLPPSDLVMVREVLQHLTNAEVARALANIKVTTRYALVTESLYAGRGFVPNLDLPTRGTLTRSVIKSGIDLRQPPFEQRARLIAEVSRRRCVLRTLLIDFHAA